MKTSKKFMKKMMSCLLLLAVVFGCVTGGTVTSAALKPLVSVTFDDRDGNSSSASKKKLYEGMQWNPKVIYEYGKEGADDNFVIEESVGTLKGVTFTSSNKKVATVDKDGIITAKKPGTAKINIASEELNKTITVKVLACQKVNKKNLTKEVKRPSEEWDWPLSLTYDNTAKDVKKGYVKANKKYASSLYSIRQYKQPNGKYRYVFAYQVLNKKGKAIKGMKLKEIPVETIMGCYGLCTEPDKFRYCAETAVKTNGKEWPHWQSWTLSLKTFRKYARENIYTSKDDFFNAARRYGWLNMCL